MLRYRGEKIGTIDSLRAIITRTSSDRSSTHQELPVYVNINGQMLYISLVFDAGYEFFHCSKNYITCKRRFCIFYAMLETFIIKTHKKEYHC